MGQVIKMPDPPTNYHYSVYEHRLIGPDEYYIAEGWSLYPLCCSDRRRQNATIAYFCLRVSILLALLF